MTSALGSVAVGSNVTVKGLVTAICARGFILTDNSGSILVYYASGFDATAYKVGDQVDVTGEVSAYNKGFQITGTTATVTVTGNQAYLATSTTSPSTAQRPPSEASIRPPTSRRLSSRTIRHTP